VPEAPGLDGVEMIDAAGEATLLVELSTRVAPGTVFATFPDPAAAVNRLTGDDRDPSTHTPAYKRTAVHLERAERPCGGGRGDLRL
jgi:formate dehydrogenase major subunit